ncbi:hypothetical protein [Rugamonas sp. DEMB1]|uniref:hypothetical protein n=1 Tax=Rugamonas sp. DEMB1 TaxID=3039386 RepID=UPI002449B31B|nr:hypothetical protein [Rugamonas sp. DEMB1]WGG51906.1 hypothetical protein QC826_06790 [Rugamonas sp. DEMB1]
MSISSKKAAPARTVPPPQRKVAAPPVYRPQAPLLQARMAAPSAAPARPLAPPVFRPQPFAPAPPVFHAQATAKLQARLAPRLAPVKPPARLLIQRASSVKQTESEVDAALRERNYQAFLDELDRDEKKAKPASAVAAKPKKLSMAAKKMAAATKAAAASAAQADEERRLAAEQAAAQALVSAVADWHEFEQGAVANLFGLMERGYLTLAAPHRCFLSAHEMAGGVRRAGSFGLSKKILLTDGLKDKYRETHQVKPAVRVLHLHCNGDGTVRSFGVKLFLAEGLVGYNYVVPPMYTARANAFVGDIDGSNVEVKVKVFD